MVKIHSLVKEVEEKNRLEEDVIMLHGQIEILITKIRKYQEIFREWSMMREMIEKMKLLFMKE